MKEVERELLIAPPLLSETVCRFSHREKGPLEVRRRGSLRSKPNLEVVLGEAQKSCPGCNPGFLKMLRETQSMRRQKGCEKGMETTEMAERGKDTQKRET